MMEKRVVGWFDHIPMLVYSTILPPCAVPLITITFYSAASKCTNAEKNKIIRVVC